LEPVRVETDLQTAMVWAKQNRQELKETQVQEEVDQLSVDLSMAERYPVFLLGGGMEVRNNDFPLNQTNWNAALNMNIPIFDGFSSLARIKENRYRAEKGRLRHIQLEDEVEREVRSAYLDWQHWTSELVSRREELSAMEAMAGPTSRANFTPEKLDIARWLLDAQTSVIDAQYQLCIAAAHLAKAMGKQPSDL
jgi:outer membrane protein TolC